MIGSVVGTHPYPDLVARLQSVISTEIKYQLIEATGKEKPDYIIACIGGGSNAAGAYFNFIEDESVKLLAVEAGGLGFESGKSAATSQLGRVGIIHGSKTLLMQDKYGQITEPYSISAGLDYPGIGPMHAHLISTGRAEVYSITDDEAIKAGILLSENEGILPALESSHALAVLDYMKFNADDLVVINLSGRGDKDLQTYLEHMKNN